MGSWCKGCDNVHGNGHVNGNGPPNVAAAENVEGVACKCKCACVLLFPAMLDELSEVTNCAWDSKGAEIPTLFPKGFENDTPTSTTTVLKRHHRLCRTRSRGTNSP